MFLSLIIPVYNAEKYIAECLESLLRQDLSPEEYEIICVNDGSRDNSLTVLQDYAGRYPNIRVISKENGGVTTARNAGIDAAQGDYIWFVDADDLVKPNILGMLRDKASQADCDRLIFGAYQFTDAMTEEELTLSANNRLKTNTSWYDAVVWRCLLRRSFLLTHGLNFRYPELTHGEDGLFMYEVTMFAPSSLELEEVLYFYRVHSGSAETSVSVESRKRKLRSHIRITQILRDYYIGMEDPKDGDANKFMVFLWMTLYDITQLPRKDAREVLAELKKCGLYPIRRPDACNLETSFMTDRTDLVGRVFDKVYLNLHTRWGYAAMRLLKKLH